MTTVSPPSSSLTTRLTLLAFLSATTIYCIYKSRRLKLLKLSFTSGAAATTTPNLSPPPRSGKLFFISQTGTAKTLAQRLLTLLTSSGLPFDLVDPADYEPEDLHKESLVLIVASTWEEGKPPSNGKFLYNWLEESADDFRVGSLLLSKCKFALFGVGSKAYGETFNAVAKGFSKRMRLLGGTEVLPVWEGDVDEGELDEEFDAWSEKVVRVLKGGLEGNGAGLGEMDGIEGESDGMNGSDDDDYDDDEEVEENGGASTMVDLEDIAGKCPSRKDAGIIKSNGRVKGEKEMVTPVIRASLTKQGYKIIGSHNM